MDNGDPQGDFMGGIQSLGIMNAMKTGDVRMDVFIAMCIPLVMRLVFGLLERAQRGMLRYGELKRWYHGRYNKYQRFLVTKTSTNHWGGYSNCLDSDTQNAVLIKAIQLYIHHNCKLNLTSADLDLTSVGSSKGSILDPNSAYYDSEDDYDSGSSNRKTLVGMLGKYSVIKKPPHRVWHKLGNFPCAEGGELEYPVELNIQRNEQPLGKDDGGRHLSIVTFHFVSPGPSSIDTFIDGAYKWYMNELRELEDNSRYLYEMSSGGGAASSSEDGNRHDGPLHVRYKLSEEKTFESLFFQQKESLLNIVGHFTNKSGKYAVKGYPHKLGLLLHGPPGTGKTSLIKALAQHTGRSIVNVPLAKISTNSELMNIFFSKKYHIRGEDVPVELGFKDVIFVMEDVDACSKIVRRRDRRKTADITHTEQVDLPAVPKSIWQMLLESNEPDCKELVELLMEKSGRLKQEALKPEVLRSMTQRMMVLPGLGLVGESNGEDALHRVGKEALDSAHALMDGYSTVDRFVSTHARSIKALLDAGAEVDDDFVNELLGNGNKLSSPMNGELHDFEDVKAAGVPAPGSFASLQKAGNVSREVSYSKYSDDGEIHLEVGARTKAAATSVAGVETDDLVKVTDDLDSVMIGPKEKGSLWASKIGKDQLNLTGLLNVLDGVVDTPGRILIMTTNHPEMLDPALIRPGRIDKKLMLGYMTAPDVIEMLQHYFQTTLDENQVQRVQAAIDGDLLESRPQVNLTPAQVEQLTAEHDDVEDMICDLEEKGLRTVAPRISMGNKSSVSSVRFNM